MSWERRAKADFGVRGGRGGTTELLVGAAFTAEPGPMGGLHRLSRLKRH